MRVRTERRLPIFISKSFSDAPKERFVLQYGYYCNLAQLLVLKVQIIFMGAFTARSFYTSQVKPPLFELECRAFYDDKTKPQANANKNSKSFRQMYVCRGERVGVEWDMQ